MWLFGHQFLRSVEHQFSLTSSNSADQLRSLGPKSDYDKDQKTEVVNVLIFYVDSWYAALNRRVRTNLAKSQSLECADNPWTPQAPRINMQMSITLLLKGRYRVVYAKSFDISDVCMPPTDMYHSAIL